MEIKVDIGLNVNNELREVAKIKEQEFNVVASEAMAIGAKVLLSSLENEADRVDPNVMAILKNSVKANEILSEILCCVFNKDKSGLGVFDADTALSVINRVVDNVEL